jgi:predicted Zn-dependent protease
LNKAPTVCNWRRHVAASSGYRELGLLAEAERALEEIDAADRSRNEVLGARLDLYMAAKQWDAAAAVGHYLVKVEPGKAGWWINYAHSVRQVDTIEKAEAILIRAREVIPHNPAVVLNLACYASATGRIEEARERLLEAIKLNKGVQRLALDDEDLKPLWDWISSSE